MVPFLRLSLFLYASFFLFRLYFWEMPESIWLVILNALADTITSVATTYIILRIIRPRVAKSVLIPWGALVFFAFNGVLYLCHKLVYTAIGSMEGKFAETFQLLSFQVFDVLVILMVGTGASYGYLETVAANKERKRVEQLLLEKRESELKALRNQINPHFLFNALNSIYFSIDKSNQEARNILNEFADLLRYQLYECSTDMVALEKEIAFIKRYIYLQEIRASEAVECTFELVGSPNDLQIPPLLLVPFIENAFKHCGAKQGKAKIEIQLRIDAEELCFRVENSVDAKARPNRISDSGGIGIENVERRLRLLFPDKRSLVYEAEESAFKIELKLPLQRV